MSASGSSPSTSLSLLHRASIGDAEAWQRIAQLYAPLVYKWCRQHGLQPEDAADVSQETFSTLAQRMSSFDAEVKGSTFRGWLWTVTRSKAMDHYRRIGASQIARGGTANVAALADLCSPENPVSLSQSYDASEDGSGKHEVLRRALAVLRSRFERQTWMAFWRTAVDGCSPEDIAEELSMSRWSVYKARSRVLQRLRTELQGLEEL